MTVNDHDALELWRIGRCRGRNWVGIAEAFAAFDSMVRLQPDAASHARVAYAHEPQGRFDEALRHMQMATEKPPSATIPNQLPAPRAGWRPPVQMGRIDDAAREFARADYVFPDHPYAR